MSDQDWELFEKINYRAAEMMVSIYKGGQISLTKAVHDTLASNYVELLYNKPLRKIGIRAANESNQNAFKLRQPQRQTSWIFSASAFLKYYQLESIKGKKFPAIKDGDVIVIDISKPA